MSPSLNRSRHPAVRANNARAVDALRTAGLEVRLVEVPTSDLTCFIEYTERAAGFETVVSTGAFEPITRQFSHIGMEAS